MNPICRRGSGSSCWRGRSKFIPPRVLLAVRQCNCRTTIYLPVPSGCLAVVLGGRGHPRDVSQVHCARSWPLSGCLAVVLRDWYHPATFPTNLRWDIPFLRANMPAHWSRANPQGRKPTLPVPGSREYNPVFVEQISARKLLQGAILLARLGIAKHRWPCCANGLSEIRPTAFGFLFLLPALRSHET